MTDKPKANQSKIIEELKISTDKLDAQINTITQRQQELQNLITSIEQGVQQYEAMVSREQQMPKPDFNKIRSMRGAITKSIELLAQLYTTYKAFEEVKFRYYKQITDLDHNTRRMIEVEIRRIESNMDNFSGGDFIGMMKSFTDQMKYADKLQTPTPLQQGAQEELKNDENYTL